MKIGSISNFEEWTRITNWRPTNLRKAEIFISIRSSVMSQILTGDIHEISPCQSEDHVWIPLKLPVFIEFFALIILVIKLSQFESVFLKIQVKYFFDTFLHFFAKNKKFSFGKIDDNWSLVVRILKPITYSDSSWKTASDSTETKNIFLTF